MKYCPLWNLLDIDYDYLLRQEESTCCEGYRFLILCLLSSPLQCYQPCMLMWMCLANNVHIVFWCGDQVIVIPLYRAQQCSPASDILINYFNLLLSTTFTSQSRWRIGPAICNALYKHLHNMYYSPHYVSARIAAVVSSIDCVVGIILCPD